MAREPIIGSAGVAWVLSVAACASAAPPATDPVAPGVATLAALTDAVLDDAARRTGLAKSALVVETAVAVTWPDGSLGCPQPGTMYTQALVPGYRIRVRAGDERFDYHAHRGGSFVLCPAGRAVESAGGAAT